MNTVPVNLMPREEWIERSREAGLDPESAAYIWDLNRDRFISTRTAKQRPVFEYSFKDILTLQDIRTRRVRKCSIIGKEGYFTDDLWWAVEAIARRDMSDLVHGKLGGIGKAGFFCQGSGNWKVFIPKKETP